MRRREKALHTSSIFLLVEHTEYLVDSIARQIYRQTDRPSCRPVSLRRENRLKVAKCTANKLNGADGRYFAIAHATSAGTWLYVVKVR